MVDACLVLQETTILFFQRGCIILHLYQQCMSDIVSPPAHWHLVLLLFFILDVLVGV